ncbi:fimbria/pilus outer membrane usher protein [Kluyvera sp. STS39-E]|uniref:fimbria/pilus outer membrane usher protein n=1 Tax=Kluyvera sp. STS39-E TaxID=3234748 RepID=UPI0034C6D718
MFFLKRNFKYSLAGILCTSLQLLAAENMPPIAKNVKFNEGFLRDGNNNIDLSRFANGANASPGKYKSSIVINKKHASYDVVEFKIAEDNSVYPCLTLEIIKLINFKPEQLPSNVRNALLPDTSCINLQYLMPETQITFDSNLQQLSIDVPQIYVDTQPRGMVNPKLWDEGIPAAMLSHYTNIYDSHYNNNTSRSLYSSLNGGMNIGSWYFRHNGSYNWEKDNGGHYNTINSYLQHDVSFLRGRMIVGQSNTSGQLFDSIQFTGVQLASDDRMLPESQRGYAPEIRGIAKTNAKVIIKQQGQVIYETTVTPGAFVINDLYPSGYGGNLDVSIQEADGSQQNFTIPYASVAQLLRPGAQQYSVTVGKLRDNTLSDEPVLYEATYQRGLTNTFTGYTGGQLSQYYRAILLGTAVGTRWGAFGADITQAYTQLGSNAGGNLSGQSYRINYSKYITETQSNITLAAYRFSSRNYLDYMTAMQTRNAAKTSDNINAIQRSKNRFSVTINQDINDSWGSFYASASMENYWNSSARHKQYQFGYSNSYGIASYDFSVNRSQSAYGEAQTSYSLNISFPLWMVQKNQPTVSVHYNHDTDGASSEQVALSGSLGEQDKYGYNLNASNDSHAGSAGSISGSWLGSMASVSGSYSTGNGYHSASMGMSGSLVAHSGGITLSPYTGDSFALIEAKGAEGAKISSYNAAKVDSFGYALFPTLNAYQNNEVTIDPQGSSLDVEFENTSQKVVPRAGAVVKVIFPTRSGTPVLITSQFDGEPVPFGAEVFDEAGNYVGAVTQGGIIYARVSNQKGILLVKWGSDLSSRCQVSYILMPASANESARKYLQQFNAPCQMPASPRLLGDTNTTMANNH